MEVLLLGTGGGPGWPNPHCRCASCLAARAAGLLRRPTCALVDDRLLLDLGPEAGRAALQAGTDLADVEAVLVTHVHTDHFDPATVYFRTLVGREPLRVVGPDPVVAECRRWLDPAGSPVGLTRVSAGDELTVAGYAVRVLPATHEALGEAVLYDVTGPDGRRLLYATDTGPWTPAALDLLAGRAYGLVLLEETYGDDLMHDGHHTIASFGRAVADLRAVGAVTDRSQVLAVHLSHENPPPAELEPRLVALGAQVLPDLTRLPVRETRDP